MADCTTIRTAKSRIPSTVYHELKKFIVDVIAEKGEVEISELVSLAIDKYSNAFYGDTGWNLLQVKLDLESRNMLKINYRHRFRPEQFISLKHKKYWHDPNED